MSFSFLFRQLAGFQDSPARNRGSRHLPTIRRAVALRLERLEDRCLLSGIPFAAQAGGPLADAGLAIAADDAGNLYVAGKTQGRIDVPDPAKVIHVSGYGDDDGFVACYTPNGALRWVQLLGGQYRDQATAIAVDHRGHVLVTGFFNGTSNLGVAPSPVQFGQINRTAPTSYFGNGFVARLSAATGAVQWVTEADSYAAAGGGGIAVDNAGNVYTAGGFGNQVQFELDASGQGNFRPVMASAINNTDNAYLMKQDTNGNLLWVKQFGTTTDGNNQGGGAGPNCIAVDGVGANIYVGGLFRSINGTPIDFSTAQNQSIVMTPSGYTDLFVEKFDGSGKPQWARQGGSASPVGQESLGESANGIALDDQGNAYIAGNFTGTAVFGNITVVGHGGPDAVVAKLDPNGNYLLAGAMGGPGNDLASAIAVRDGRVYSTGYFTQTADLDPSPQAIVSLSALGYSDAFVSVLSTSGQFLCARQTGQQGSAVAAAGIVVGHDGFVSATGSFTAQATFVLVDGPNGVATQRTSAGDTDIFVHRRKIECSPTHADVIDGHILHIEGDNQANRIQITDDRHWGITVALDDEAPRMFQGIDHIEVMTAGGNDMVAYRTSTAPSNALMPNIHPADLTFDLGRGDDTVTLNGTGFSPGESEQNPGPWTINMMTGDGDDMLHANIEGSAAMRMAVDLGRDNDSSIYEFGDVEQLPNPDELTVQGGPGNDSIRVTHGIIIEGGMPTSRGPFSGITDNIGGGPGDDDIRVTSGFVIEGGTPIPGAAPIAVNIDGGLGNDHILNEWLFNALPGNPGDPPLAFNVPLTSNLSGGQGNNDIQDIYAFNPQPEPPGFPGLIINAPINANLDPGRGDNTMSVNFFHEASSDRRPAMLYLNSALSVNMLGGLGRDIMDLNIGSGGSLGEGPVPCVMPAGSVMAMLDGRSGNDIIRANMSFDRRSQGRVDAQVFGGRNSDDLTLEIYGISDDLLDALVDGGPGIDTAHHTSNVRVVNCER